MRPKYKSGRRSYLSDPTACVRSGVEAKVLLWLDSLGIKWLYEAKEFRFTEGTRGAKRYLPDIWVPNYKPNKRNGLPDLGLKELHIECKGRMDGRSHMQLVHFIRDFPDEAKKLVAITRRPNDPATAYYIKKGIPILAFYEDLDKEYGHLKHWGE